MYPVLFKIGDVTFYGYGTMLLIAVISGILIFVKECRRKNLTGNTPLLIILFSFLSFYFGSKIFFFLEYGAVSEISQYLFSTSGFSFLGGLITFLLLIFLYSKISKISVLNLYDAVVPSLVLMYAIVRIGCHLAGDGDYGIFISPDSAWAFLGVGYPNGTLPTPPGALVHPTAVYEVIFSGIVFLYFWKKRADWTVLGKLFSMYLILMGSERFLIEFINVNPKILLGLSLSQICAFVMILVGLQLYLKVRRIEEETFFDS